MAVSYASNTYAAADNNAFVQEIIDRGKAEATRNTGELGKEEFLNLLVLQLRYQDPLNPMEDKEFIAQMAQFSALEQMQNMNASANATKAFSLIGKYVGATLSDESTGQSQEVVGHVESVYISGSKTYVVVDGKQVPIENVHSISEGYNPLSSSLSAYTGLLGYNVMGAVYDVSTGAVVGVEGSVASLAKGTYEDYAILNGVSAVISGINVDGALVSDRTRLHEYMGGFDGKTDPKELHVEVFVTDANGVNVPIGATLSSYEIDPDGTVRAVLDDVAIPVSSVATIGNARSAAPDEDEDDSDSGNNGLGDDGTTPPDDGLDTQSESGQDAAAALSAQLQQAGQAASEQEQAEQAAAQAALAAATEAAASQASARAVAQMAALAYGSALASAEGAAYSAGGIYA
ncbi:MAG: flagellar biosynthesis protein FlgD [Clostridiales bacterium]|jgi:flagellar basal-body rod modification protein FlgD|nr:flagellar biosynthesis protein FlgD [Clostridiales bacterium]